MDSKMQKIYDDALEDWPMATEAIMVSHKKMHDDFDSYIAAIQESSFWYGYQCAIKSMGGPVA